VPIAIASSLWAAAPLPSAIALVPVASGAAPLPFTAT
jgi:hypothetical protein